PAHVPGSSLASAGTLGPAIASTTTPSSESNPQDTSAVAPRDGRIRNPVPSKLKGKTDGSKGNFGVMQIEVAGRSEATDRDAEAKRTSESTELAAKRAFENGYVSLRRSRFVHLPDEPVAKPFIPSSAPAPAPPQTQRPAPLGPEETKSEQARLLTLLRSLHPVLVVDQICKALAFFGGIPGALPPANGGFPESAEANGSGSLFVGWIAEIFPRLGGNSGQQNLDPTRQLDNSQPVKRKRGRPKGSKATKARKDKGVKKGSVKTSTNTALRQPSDVPDDSWVDDDENGIEAADDVDVSVTILARPTSPNPQLQGEASNPSSLPLDPNQTSGATLRTALPGAPAVDGTPSARKRGRPKGSKNKPKELAPNSLQTPVPALRAGAHLSQGHRVPSQIPEAPQVNQTPQGAPAPAGPQSFTAVNSMSPAATTKKVRRAKGTAPRPQGQGQSNPVPSAPQQQDGAGYLGLANSMPTTQMQATTHQAPQAAAVSQAQPPTISVPPAAGPNPPSSAKSAGQKRKRKGGVEADASWPRPNDGGGGGGSSSVPDVNGQELPVPPSSSRPPPSAAAPEPLSKRQRKGKDPKPKPKNANEAAGPTASRPPPRVQPVPFPSDSVPNSSPIPGPAHPVTVRNTEARLGSTSAVDASMSPTHPPQQGHFEIQSPMTESFEAQIQAQLVQPSETEPRTMASPNAPDSMQLLKNRLPPQHKGKYTQQQQHQMDDSVHHGRSPNPQPPPAKSQVLSSPLVSQLQARTSQGHFTQYRPSGSQFQQQHQQQQQQHHRQQEHQGQGQGQGQGSGQSYVSSQTEHPQPQQQAQQFSGEQQHQGAQQYAANTSQHQQYAASQHSYTPSQQQYSSGQAALTSQHRYQHQLATTSSAGPVSYSTHQSPHFGQPGSSNFGSTENGYRSSATALSNASYAQRSQPGATPFRPTGTHGLPQHSPSFGTGSTGLQQQRSTGTGQPTSQSMQGLANVQAFAGNAASDWGLFDASHLDAAGQQGTMALNSTNYSLGTASVRAPSNAGATFAATGLTTFDASSLGAGDRYYGVGRR
ncbi:hypothetical protein C8A05DRAFT_11443, partial [Staphylotrichum tortipilum]